VLRISLEASIGDKTMKLVSEEAPAGSFGWAEISDDMREFQEFEEVEMYAIDDCSTLWFASGRLITYRI
jgi:hypothetical protein